MTARQFRGTYAWKQARRNALRGAYACAICGGPLLLDAGRYHRLYPTVDHVFPLARLDLATAAGRAVALDQANLRVVHNACNASRGAREAHTQRAADSQAARAARSAFFADRARASREW
jgi:5-methylcytosine-specific restriction endonuclease McrA